MTGLSEKELPVETCPSGVMYIEISRLDYGAGQDLRHNKIGYVAFDRTNSNSASGKTTEVRNFEFYRDEVLIPFFSLIQEKVYGWIPGSAIPNELTAVSWINGGKSQLDSMLDENTHRRIWKP